MKNLLFLPALLSLLFMAQFSSAQEETEVVEIHKVMLVDGEQITTDTVIVVDGNFTYDIGSDMDFEIIQEGDSITLTLGDLGSVELHCDGDEEAEQIFVTMTINEDGEDDINVQISEDSETVIVKTIEVTAEDDGDGNVKIFYVGDDEVQTQVFASIIVQDIRSEDIIDFQLSDELLENSLNAETVEFYPNPNEGLFNLKMDSKTASDIDVKIFDESGRMIQNRKLKGKIGELEESFDVSEFGAGAYFISIEQSGKLISKKILVN